MGHADWGPGPPAPGWHVSQRFVNAEGFPIVGEEEEEEEESLFKADAVNEEDSERDRATQV